MRRHSHEQPSTEDAEPQHDDRAVFWDAQNPLGYANQTGVYKTRVEWSFIRQHLPPAPAAVLDIAGGSGRFALPLTDEGYALTVVDKDAPSLRLLQERAGEKAPVVICSDFRDAKIPGAFDAAIAVECLENMPFADVLGRVRGLLKPQGVFAFTVLNRSSWRFGPACRREGRGRRVRRAPRRLPERVGAFGLRGGRSAWVHGGAGSVSGPPGRGTSAHELTTGGRDSLWGGRSRLTGERKFRRPARSVAR